MGPGFVLAANDVTASSADNRGGAGASTSRRVAAVVSIAAPTADVRVLRMEVVAGPSLTFEAGQYVQVVFAGLPPRDYSLANTPSAAVLEFHVRVNAERGVGRHIRDRLAVGDRVSVVGPFGDAFLRREHTGPMLAVAGGTGLVPIRSIVDTALGSGMRQPIHLYVGAREPLDLYDEPYFRALAGRYPNLQWVPVISGTGAAAGRRTGNVADAVAADFRSLTGFKAYVAGPPAMVEATQRVLADRGVLARDIHADPFTAGDHHSSAR